MKKEEQTKRTELEKAQKIIEDAYKGCQCKIEIVTHNLTPKNSVSNTCNHFIRVEISTNPISVYACPASECDIGFWENILGPTLSRSFECWLVMDELYEKYVFTPKTPAAVKAPLPPALKQVAPE